MEQFKYKIEDIALEIPNLKLSYVQLIASRLKEKLNFSKLPNCSHSYYYDQASKDFLINYLNTKEVRTYKKKDRSLIESTEGYTLYSTIFKTVEGIEHINKGHLQVYLKLYNINFVKINKSLYIPDTQVIRCKSMIETFVEDNYPDNLVPNNYISMEFKKMEKSDKIQFLYKLCNTCDVIEEIILKEEIKNKIKQ